MPAPTSRELEAAQDRLRGHLVETPLIARGHLPLSLGPIHLELAAGAGLYFGLHNITELASAAGLDMGNGEWIELVALRRGEVRAESG